MKYRFSVSNQTFYPINIHYDNLPDDCILISEEEYKNIIKKINQGSDNIIILKNGKLKVKKNTKSKLNGLANNLIPRLEQYVDINQKQIELIRKFLLKNNSLDDEYISELKEIDSFLSTKDKK